MEKKRIYVFDLHQRYKKTLTILRATLLLTLISTFSLQAGNTSQHGRLTLKMQNATIDELIKSVRAETEYKFLYRIEEVQKYGKRDIDIKDATIEEFLQKILANTQLSYEIQNGVIIIRPQQKVREDYKPRVIKGKVMDDKGLPLPGVSVIIKGTTLGIATGINGEFKLEIPKLDSTILVFSFIGMQTVEHRLKEDRKDDNKDLIIRMKEDVTEVDEVVITGIANIRKESFTGSSVTIHREELLKVSKTNVIKALQVFDPSFRIQTNNEWGSDPNALPEMYIRGRSGIGLKELDKLKADQAQGYISKSALKDNPNLPTFIMDGFEISVQKLYDMDPTRIESVTILKDAAATAMYGSRAANGVVVITTVAPKAGSINVSYSFDSEITMPDLTDYNLTNAAEKLETEVRAGIFEAEDEYDRVTLEKIYHRKQANVAKGVDTYWLSLPLRTTFNHKHALFVEGGSETLRFGLDVSYHNQDGIMKESFRNRFGVALYIDYRLKSLQVKNQVSYTVVRSQESPFGSFSEYTKAQPYDVYKDKFGRYLENLDGWGETLNKPNPLYESTLGSFEKSSTEEITNNLSINWYATNHLLIKGEFSITKEVNDGKKFLDPLSKRNSQPLSSYNTSSGELRTNDGKNFNWNLNFQASYNRNINKHNINALAGINARSTKTTGNSAFYRGFPSGSLCSPNYAQTIVQKPSYSENSTRLIGFVGLVNYSYNNIYLFDASIRVDGSSEFGVDNKYATFWSTGAGINIHNYAFLKNNSIIEQLKIKGTYGQTGKVNFAPYQARTTYEILSEEWYKTGYGASLKALGNKDLTWETTNKINLGIELGLLKQAFYVDFNYYNEKTVDLVNSVTIRSSTGFTTYVDNIGKLRKTGFEINMRSNLISKGNLFLALLANLAHNEDKLLEIAQSLKDYNNQVNDHFTNSSRYDGSNTKPFRQFEEGGSLTSIFGVRSLGIDPASGNEILVKKDGTLTDLWNANDQVILGNEEPKAKGSFGMNATYKNFSLFVTFSYEWGGQIYNQTLVDKVENVNIRTTNVDKRVLKERWKEPGDIAKYRKINLGIANQSEETTRPSSRFVEDNNWLSLNSVTLGYDFDREASWMRACRLSMLRLEIGGSEIFRWSTVKAERGLSYPFARSFSFSIKASF